MSACVVREALQSRVLLSNEERERIADEAVEAAQEVVRHEAMGAVAKRRKTHRTG